MSAEDNLAKLGLVLPPTPAPIANYISCRRAGSTLYLAGQGPRKADGGWHTGKLGQDVTVEEAYGHARLTGLSLLSLAKEAAGSLDAIEIVKVLGLVNATPDFTHHAQVIDGCSDLFIATLGEAGRHARSAIGVGSLPMNITVEIECIIQIRGP
jgi:enamine deaminase RidA (YjgF/YER057c/UK114 family)